MQDLCIISMYTSLHQSLLLWSAQFFYHSSCECIKPSVLHGIRMLPLIFAVLVVDALLCVINVLIVDKNNEVPSYYCGTRIAFITDAKDRPMRILDCTAEGVLFIEADADIGLEQLGNTIQPPFPYVDEVPFDVPVSSGIVGCHLLSIQVICLICVGFIFAVRPNHAICVIGLVQFLDAIREMVRGADKPSQLPVWQREIFSA